MVARIVVFLLLAAVFVGGGELWQSAIAPEMSTDLALAQVNGGDADAVALRTYEQAARSITVLQWASIVVLILACFAGPLYRELTGTQKSKALFGEGCRGGGMGDAARSFLFVLFVGALLASSGCRQPYDVPEYVEVATNETAFVVPLEGDTAKQVAFDSAEQLDQHKVAAKRIRITHRFNQTGRYFWSGEWIDNIRVIKVSRTPITREWVTGDDRGTGNKDEAIWAESSDSVGFSTGITCTGMVSEADTALFLYSYNGQSLAQVMDTEVRARVQMLLSEFSAKYVMDALRNKKGDMMTVIREGVVPFFKDKGMDITTIGQFGGFAYENPAIQEAIDKVFIAQQEKQVANAQLVAQEDKNKRLKMEGEGEAAKLREMAKGRKDAAITEAEGRASAIAMIAAATKEAGQDPLFLEIRRLEVELERIKRWDGRYPSYMMTMGGDGAGLGLLLNVPGPTVAAAD
ncbi:MAG: hypothetical protein U9M92_02040 [Patescibacteria group bacterium]|nr:hypothetical protein [Patescibacteria group bacterium]